MLYSEHSYAQYEQLPGVRSHQLINLYYGSPKLMRWRLWHPESPTPALQFGIVFHAALLEGRAPHVLPEQMNGTTKKAMAHKIAWMHDQINTECPELATLSAIELRAHLAMLKPQLDALNKIYVDAPTSGVIQAMCESAHAHPILGRYLHDGAPEQTITAMIDTIPCKARIDLLLAHEDPPIIIDIKSVPSLATAQQAIRRYHYPFQLEVYRRVYYEEYKENPCTVLAMVEKDQPHDVALFEVSGVTAEQANEEVQEALQIYRSCVDAHLWPGHGWSWPHQRYEVIVL